jgi:hypothetical protein
MKEAKLVDWEPKTFQGHNRRARLPVEVPAFPVHEKLYVFRIVVVVT